MVYRGCALLLGTAGALLAAAGSARAQSRDGLRITGSSRLRVETIAGQARQGFNSDDTLIGTRTMIMAEYRADPVRFVAELHDSREWNGNAGSPISSNEVNTVELVQAHLIADLGAVLGRGSALTVQAGRFTMALGSRRLIAADEYRNTTNGSTGLRADIAGRGGMQATLFYVLPQTRLPEDPAALRRGKIQMDRESFDQVLWGALASRTRHGLTVEAGFVHFGERDAPGRPTRDRSLDTASARVIAAPEPGHFDYEAEAMVQWGRASASLASAAARQTVRATFFHVDAGYSFPGPWQPRVSIEYDRASGDGPGGANGRFDTLFGMRRADLAPSGIYAAVGRANVSTPGARIEATTPSTRLDFLGTYHALWLADRHDAFSTTGVRDASGKSGAFAGHQFDIRLRYWLVPRRLRFEFDGVLLAKGRFLREAPNAPPGRTTRYASFNLTASF